VPLKEFLLFVAIVAAWIVLNRWVLPWFGVATCMSGACAAAKEAARNEPVGKEEERDR